MLRSGVLSKSTKVHWPPDSKTHYSLMTQKQLLIHEAFNYFVLHPFIKINTSKISEYFTGWLHLQKGRLLKTFIAGKDGKASNAADDNKDELLFTAGLSSREWSESLWLYSSSHPGFYCPISVQASHWRLSRKSSKRRCLRQSSGSVTHCSTISLRFGFSMAAATRSLSLICLLTGDTNFTEPLNYKQTTLYRLTMILKIIVYYSIYKTIIYLK